ARLERGDTVGDGVDGPCKLRSGHERQRILGLVKPLHFQPIDEADRRGADLDAHLSIGGRRLVNFLDRDAVDRIVVLDINGLHWVSLMCFLVVAPGPCVGMLRCLRRLQAKLYSAASACRSISIAPALMSGIRSRPIAIVSCGFSKPRSRNE